jgi:hypothetical protein
MASSIEIGIAPEGPQALALKRANRHGLIAGATGTGKTVTLQVLAEGLAREGVNVFAADIKGDLSAVKVRSRYTPRLGPNSRPTTWTSTPQASSNNRQ